MLFIQFSGQGQTKPSSTPNPKATDKEKERLKKYEFPARENTLSGVNGNNNDSFTKSSDGKRKQLTQDKAGTTLTSEQDRKKRKYFQSSEIAAHISNTQKTPNQILKDIQEWTQFSIDKINDIMLLKKSKQYQTGARYSDEKEFIQKTAEHFLNKPIQEFNTIIVYLFRLKNTPDLRDEEKRKQTLENLKRLKEEANTLTRD